MRDENLYIYTHIPKCAGNTILESLFLNNIRDDLFFRPENFLSIIKNKRDFRYIIGHWPIGIETFINPFNYARKRKKVLFTFLRLPADHLISYYFFQKQLGKYSRYSSHIRNKSIIEFYQTTPDACNLQTKFCAGILYHKLFKKIGFEAGSHFQLKVAKQNLLKKFNFVGQFENIKQDMQLFAQIYGINFQYRYSNVTKTLNRLKLNDLSSELIEQLVKLNSLDIELYNFANKNIFSKRKNNTFNENT